MVLNRQQAINDDSILRCIVCITKLEWVNCSWWSYRFKNILVPCCEWDIAHVLFPWMAVRYYFPRKKVAKRKRSASSSDDEVKKKPTPGEFHFVSWNKNWKLLTHWFLWGNRLIQDLVPIGNRSWPEPMLTMMKIFFFSKETNSSFQSINFPWPQESESLSFKPCLCTQPFSWQNTQVGFPYSIYLSSWHLRFRHQQHTSKTTTTTWWIGNSGEEIYGRWRIWCRAVRIISREHNDIPP